MITRIGGLIVGLVAFMVPAELPAQQQRARSILFLDQSDLRGPFYYEIFVSLRERVTADVQSHITLYRESLDLSRFAGETYEASLRQHLKEKYRARPIGVIVAIGSATLELVQRWRTELWPGVPVVFGLVDQADVERMKLSPDVTGGTVRLRLADSIQAARAVVPDLDSIAFVGDDWDRQVVFSGWKNEIGTAAAGLKVTELIGLTMTELRQRLATLPDRSAILYSAVYFDGEGGFYPPAVALGFIAEKANRPIVVASETFLKPGGIGGFVLLPREIGADAASRAVRIINGEAASAIPVAIVNAVRPIFNWQQMQRWNVTEADLPPGSEIRFREPGIWERYRWQGMSVIAAFLAQVALISILLHERKRRGDAELEARQRLSELAHVHRQAIAGELSSSIAHQLNQPLSSILTNAETAELILDSPSPDLREIKEILADIRDDDLRASQVIAHMRGLLKRTPFELKQIDLNQVMRSAFDVMSAQGTIRDVALYLKTCPEPLWVKGDRVQLQQVILNLIANGMDAMTAMSSSRTIVGRTEIDDARVLISISDSGSGIAADKLDKIFDPFFTTKQQGMGIGLSIARTIVEAHKGRMWAANRSEGGAAFFVSLPLSTP
jgi:signal transduction histidine kinase